MSYLPTWPIAITPLTAFGLMLIIGCIGGYLAHRLSWLPSITGFMVVGLLCGPSGLGLLNEEMIAGSQVLIDVALALILYRLGLSLDIKFILRSPSLLFTSLFESALTFSFVFFVLYLFEIPIVVATLIASITISSSPAVLLHVANEVGAKGEVTESTKTLVALNNLISFIAFSITLPLMHYTTGGDWGTILFEPLYRLGGSLLLGFMVAFGLHEVAVKMQEAPQYKLALVIGAIMIAMGLANELKLSMLSVPLVVGIVVKSLEQETVVSDLTFGPSFELFFIILFVFAGAALKLKALVEFSPVLLALVIARSLAKSLSVSTASALFKKSFRTGIASGLLLIPMAGLAIGLAQTAINLFPQHASIIAVIIFGSVTVFETIGPPIAAYAFRVAGEITESDDDEKGGPNNMSKTSKMSLNNPPPEARRT